MRIHEIGPDDWERFREIRLRALADAPYAFSSTYEEEGSLSEARWRERVAGGPSSVRYAADRDGRWLGIAGAYLEPGEPTVANLVSMWVDPDARGRRIGSSLVEAAMDWARSHGASTIDLWVTETSAPARALYEAHGFVPTGGRQRLPSDPTLFEIEMSRTLLRPD